MPDEQNRPIRFGDWQVQEFIGKGGNAKVWRCRRASDGRIAAVKVSNSRNPSSEPYQRFRNEVRVIQDLGDYPGVLPIIEASVPEMLNPNDRAWMAMPEAVPLSIYLADSSLEEIVAAISSIASTLANLARRDIFHRDIKPDNLYYYNGAVVVGDFGLVDRPGQPALTQPGRKLGPLHFHAPEMLSRPEEADAGPADVWSLAKTLWVLSSGQRFPPAGEQRVDTPSVTLKTYVDHPRRERLAGP